MTEPVKLTSGPLAGKTVEVASQARVVRLELQVQRVLDALGFGDAVVTDRSQVGDFFWDRTVEDEDALRGAATELGVALRFDDYIADVAERLMGGH